MDPKRSIGNDSRNVIADVIGGICPFIGEARQSTDGEENLPNHIVAQQGVTGENQGTISDG